MIAPLNPERPALLRGGTILTLDPGRPRAEAVAIAQGRVLAVGSLGEARAAVPSDALELDLGGGCLIPSFVDVHHHVLLGALLVRFPRCERSAVRTTSDVLQLLRAAAEASPGDGWAVVVAFDPSWVREESFPTLAQLDQIAPSRPVAVLSASLHEAAVNRSGLKRLGLDDPSRAQPAGMVLGRDEQPTGEVVDLAAAVLLQQVMEEGLRDRTRCAADLAVYTGRMASAGITAAVDPGLSRGAEQVMHEAISGGHMAIDVSTMAASDAGLFLPPLDRLEDQPGQLKIFVDGGAFAALSFSGGELLRGTFAILFRALAQRSMRLLRRATRYKSAPGPDKRYHSGNLMYTPATLKDLCAKAIRAGWSLALHAQGNEAIGMALDAVAQRDRPAQDGRPDQIVHFTFPTPAHLQRTRELGVALVLQPRLFEQAASDWATLMPRGAFFFGPPLRDLVAAGVSLSGSSDAPVGDFQPLRAVAAAMRPSCQAGVRPSDPQGLSGEQALSLYTTAPAHVMGKAGTRALRAGIAADMVLLSGEPAQLSPEAVAAIEVQATVRGGASTWISKAGR